MPSLLPAWPIAVILSAVAIYFWFGWDQFLTFEILREHRENLLEWSNENRLLAMMIFVIGYAILVACSLPGATWMTLGGGFVFGTVAATAAVVFSATLGSVVIFLVSRYTFSNFVRAKMGDVGRRIETGFRENALSYLLFLRLVPVFPFWLVNIVPAFVGVQLQVYVVGTFIGIIPGSLIYCSIGNGLGAIFEVNGQPDLLVIFQPYILGPIMGLAVLSLIPVIYKWASSSKE